MFVARGLAAASDARDQDNPFHGRNVADLAVLFGARLGIEPDELGKIEAAALLHDVGTLALTDAVIDSASRSSLLAKREHAKA
jgi:HD-GYP domain-containing protein (c-di-GMP phosphodiesterase class II)